MTREEAIQVLQTALTSPLIYGEYALAIGMAIEALSANTVQGWIPVTERLPEEGLTVLTYDAGAEIDFGEYENGKWYWLAESCADYWVKNDGVIAWMPLPKPYKGGGTE